MRRLLSYGVLLFVLCQAGRGVTVADQVVLSEIMVAPREGEPAWIEIANLTATPFDLAEWELKGKDLEFRFPAFSETNPARTFLDPFERILLSGLEPAALRQTLKLRGADVRVFGPWTEGPRTQEDSLQLLDKNGKTLTKLSYDIEDDWPAAGFGTGHTLEVIDDERSTRDRRNWRVSDVLGGSPGTDSLPPDGKQLNLPVTRNFEVETLFGYAASWRFLDDGRDPDPRWRQLDYDDSKWKEGEGLFGFEESPLPAPGIQAPLRRGQVAYLFRKSFELETVTEGMRLSVDHVLDDGAVYYLNGRRVGRIRMRASGVTRRNLATATVADAIEELDVLEIPTEFLRSGRNVMAVHVGQVSESSTDLVFGARVKLLKPKPGNVRVTRIGYLNGSDGYVEVTNLGEQGTSTDQVRVQFLDHVTGRTRTFPLGGSDEWVTGASHRFAVDFTAEPGFRPTEVQLVDAGANRVIDAIPVHVDRPGIVATRDLDVLGHWTLRRDSSSEENADLPKRARHSLLVNELFLDGEGEVSWVEIRNQGEVAILPEALSWSLSSGALELRTLTQGIGARESIVLPLSERVGEGVSTFVLANRDGEVLEAHRFSVSPERRHFSRIPGEREQWFVGGNPTPGKENEIPGPSGIVINEIMADPAFGNEDGEFLELFNAGTSTVDLSGAEFDSGISYRFPPDTRLRGGEYLVLTKNSDWLNDAFGRSVSSMEYEGRLANSGERLRLVDPLGNVMDEVWYEFEGDWPERASGRGSSLELVHPDLDNAQSSAWRSSREARKSEFRRYSVRGTFLEVARMGRVKDFRELHLYLVGESHLVLKNLVFRSVDNERNLLPNELKLSTDAFGDDGAWLIQGNHADSFVEGDRLHLIAHGHGDNRANRAEIDVPLMEPGEEYELSFDARWVAGSPRLVVHTWDNSFSESILLDVPRVGGTPGMANSVGRSIAPPQVESLRQVPPVPDPGQAVKVTAIVTGENLARVELFHRPVDDSTPRAWQRVVMTDDGENGDSEAADHVYTGWLTGYDRPLQIAQYFVKGSNQGGDCYLPRSGEAKPALLIFDDRELKSDLRSLRFVVAPYDVSSMLGWRADAGGKYPRLSNQYFNATFISNEGHIYPGAELRRSGSPWTRSGGLSRGKWKLPKDREFRDHGKFSFDDDPEGWARHHNRVVRYLLYLMGHPSCENEFVRVVINGERVMLREDVEPVDADFLNRNFKDGNDGELYRIDDQWWFTDDWRRAHRDATWEHVGSDAAGWYRNAWMKRSREEEDDYSYLVEFFRVISGRNYTTRGMEAWLDVDQVLRATAVMGMVGDWDTFTQRRGKNAYFYRRADDGRFQFLQWDSDLAFRRDGYRFFGGSAPFVDWIQRPENLNRFWVVLAMLNEYCNTKPARFNAWMEAEERAHPETAINRSFYRDWFDGRARDVEAVTGN